MNLNKRIHLEAIVIWFLLLFVAIFNAVIRETTYKPIIGDLAGHQISTVTGIIFFGLVYYIWLRKTNADYTEKDLLLVGAWWLSLTISFEFIFGHYVMGNSWSHLLRDYNILKGRVWVLILIWTLLGPYIINRFLIEKNISAKNKVPPQSDKI